MFDLFLQKTCTYWICSNFGHDFHRFLAIRENKRILYTQNSFTITLQNGSLSLPQATLRRQAAWSLEFIVNQDINLVHTSITSANVEVGRIVSQEPATRGPYDPRKLFSRNVWKWQSPKIVRLENLVFTPWHKFPSRYMYIHGTYHGTYIRT